MIFVNIYFHQHHQVIRISIRPNMIKKKNICYFSWRHDITLYLSFQTLLFHFTSIPRTHSLQTFLFNISILLFGLTTTIATRLNFNCCFASTSRRIYYFNLHITFVQVILCSKKVLVLMQIVSYNNCYNFKNRYVFCLWFFG